MFLNLNYLQATYVKHMFEVYAVPEIWREQFNRLCNQVFVYGDVFTGDTDTWVRKTILVFIQETVFNVSTFR